ncbi:hypothetical protein Adeg_0817 [Ammonifex degensii KC4]|uniref:DUF6922 domain-containing protein n=1 Tax=Ammonifex degensii (strain DSM 10501 / KC4) TaxID=429009 RepID=C9RCI2_AMMDK|nr:hypothetical protein [Ammonifex degensii]ACX51959.1 hypothetical protein Adeg_0817 [Ammonifex degensii KC4]
MASVPERFRVIFWDVRPESLDVREHKRFIIERVLEFGDEDAYRWMFATYADEEIVAVARASPRISPRTAVMLANFYGIPEEEFECLRSVSLRKPRGS